MSTSTTTSRTQYLYVSGDQAGAGKTTVCLGILSKLIQPLAEGGMGVDPQRVAYIKPCTQCEDVTIVWKYCKFAGIACVGIGPVRFYKGFTYKAIEQTQETDPELLRHTIRQSVFELGKDKDIVVVDGVGYPSVGSCAGISNAQIAQILGAKVIHVGRSGVGNALDSLELHLAYFASFGIKVSAVVFNKCPTEEEQSGRHSLENVKKYTSMYLQREKPSLSILGYIPMLNLPDTLQAPKVCVLTPATQDLSLSPSETDFIHTQLPQVTGNLNLRALFHE